MAALAGADVNVVGALGDGAIVVLPLLVVAVAVWRLDRQSRTGGALEPLVPGSARLAQKLAPELLGLLLVATLVCVAIIVGENNNGQAHSTTEHEAVWSSIRREWQLLMTADTLLAMQAILRFVLLCSAAARQVEFKASALCGEASALLLFAGCARCTLLWLSPKDVYHLDGPLGGPIYAAVEVASTLLLIPLASSMMRKGASRVVIVMVLGLLAGLCAEFTHFAVAEASQSYLDALFAFAHFADVLAAAAFWLQTVLASGYAKDPFSAFACLILPVQQFLAMYFLLTWVAAPFEVVPELVGAGHPFQILEASSIIAVGLYIFAASLHFAMTDEEKGEDTVTPDSMRAEGRLVLV
mmetsp:Transcript_54200/g.129123  ORF Transcript_54200/g.129123 Transcript_54200/m.129123 type:complete len:355 (-) Transcript_54200:106-1170(-)